MSAFWLHYHPDGIVYIRDLNDVPVYEAKAADFAHDFGSPFPALPTGAVQLELFEGQVFLYDRLQNELPAHPAAAPYQVVLDALSSLQAAKLARVTPVPVVPTQAQLDELARLAAIDATIQGFSFNGTTLAQLKAMDNAAFDSWWSANITTLAQANTVLKLLARTALHRLL